MSKKEMPLEEVESASRTWGQEHHPDASEQHHAAFMNSVVYALFRFTGRMGGPSVREHAASAALNGEKTPTAQEWVAKPRKDLYEFLDPIIYGPIQDLHIRSWITMKDICFDDDLADIESLNAASEGVVIKDVHGGFETTRIWAQTLRKFRLIAAMRDEKVVESFERLANEELARLHYDPHAHAELWAEMDRIKQRHKSS